jgi:hypothetical protein
MSALLLGLVVTVAIAQVPAPPAGAEPSGPSATVPNTSGPTLQPSTPFQRLFVPTPGDARGQERMRAALEQLRLRPEADKPKIVCGMVVLRADPQVDPQMVKRPTESTTTMHIRKIPPSACAE